MLPGSARQHVPRHLPGLGMSGRVPAARGRAVALRVEPLPKAQRLAPDGRPSLTRIQSGRQCRQRRRQRPVPVPGDRGPCFLHAARERGPLGELTGLQVAALRSARCGAGQIATPVTRHARCRAAECRDAEKCTQRLCRCKVSDQRLDRRASRCAWWHVGRRAAAARDRSVGCTATAAPGELAHRLRRCVARGRWQPVRQSSHRAPPSCAPVKSEGDLWGDLQAVGRETGSLLRLLKIPPIPNPFP